MWMTEPPVYQHRASGDVSGVHLSNQLNAIHSLLVLILQKLDKAECRSKPKAWLPKWLTPQTAFWLAVCALAIGGHITLDEAKLLLSGLPK